MQPAEVNQSGDAHSTQSPLALWTQRITLLLLVATSAVLRFLHLADKPFWFDEGFSVEVARVSWPNFLHLLWWREANMALYYLLLRAWLHWGQSPFFIRSLSAVIGMATVPAIYWLARMLYNQRVAFIAAALFTVNAYHVRYSQEGRSYSLLVLLATLSSSFLLSWLQRPSLRNRRGYVLTSILAVYSHLYAVLLLVCQGIVLQWFPPRDVSKEVSKQTRRAWQLIGVAILPLLIFVAKTGAGPIKWIHRPSLRELAGFFEHLSGSNTWPLALMYLVAGALAVASVGKDLWRPDRPWETWRVQFLLSWLFFPIVLTVILSFKRPVFLGRYMIFCLPPLVILAAAGLARLRQWLMLAIALGLMLSFCLQGVSYVYGHDFDEERDASGAASNFVLDHAEPGDGIVFHIAATRVPYEFFRSLRAGGNGPTTGTLGPEIIFPRHGSNLDYRDFTGKPTADLLRGISSEHPRLWVMLMNNGSPENPDPTTIMMTRELAASFPQMQRFHFAKVELRLYARP